MHFPVLFILTFLSAKADRDLIPVFLMDESGLMSHLTVDGNPFNKLKTSYFAEIVHDSIKRSEVVIIFVENQFSVEDVSIKDKLGTPYQHLHEGLLKDKVKYFPGVLKPYWHLNRIFQPQAFNVFYLKSGTNLEMIDSYFKYFYVFFEDGQNETRAQVLRKHDEVIREVYSRVHKTAPKGIVAFYTGKINPVVVERIQFVPIAPISVKIDPGVTVVTEGALFRLVGVYAATQARRAMFNQIPMVTEETWTLDSLSTSLTFTDFELVFNFTFKEKEWRLDHVALQEGGEEVGRIRMGVGASWNWAYYCGEPMEIRNNRDGSAIVISEYQVVWSLCYYYRFQIKPHLKRFQRQRDSKLEHDARESSGIHDESDDYNFRSFGKSVNCGPYFPASLLVCLFVVAICLCILAFGLVFMFDCRSYNRYEDPHGTPLMIQFESGY